MNLLVPDHLPPEWLARWAALDPRLTLHKLGVSRHEAPLRRTVRAAAARWLPHAAYAGLLPLLAPRVRHSFTLDGQPLTAPQPRIDAFVATWLVTRGAWRALRPYLPGLAWVHSTRTGVDHLLAPELQQPGLRLTCSRGLHSGRIAEFVLALVMAHAKRLLEHRALQQAGRWEELTSHDLAGQAALVLGTGSLGQAIARRLGAQGLRVTGVNRAGRPAEGFAATAATQALAELIPTARYVISTLPLTAETRGLLGAPLLERIPRGALLINVGRDEVLDEAAMLTHLRTGRFHAALEITRPGHLPGNHPFNRLPNVLVTHYSSYTGPTANVEIFQRIEDNLRRSLAGEPLLGLVDPAAGY